MKTQLLSFMMMIFMSLPIMSQNFDLGNDLGSGWSSKWDAESKTITWEEGWAGRGWWLSEDGMDFSDYSEVVIEYEPIEFRIKLVVEYLKDGEKTNVDGWGEAGSTSISVALDPEFKSNIVQIYIQAESAGSLILKNAYIAKTGESGGDSGDINEEDAIDIPFNEYGHVLLADLQKYDNNCLVKLSLIVTSGAGVQTQPGWGIGSINPIGNYDVKNYEINCLSISEQGEINEFSFNIGELISYSKVDGETYTDSYGQQGITINTWGGATRESIKVYPNNTYVSIEETQDISISIISTEYYDLTGTLVINPNNGIYLKKDLMSNGKIEVKKVYILK